MHRFSLLLTLPAFALALAHCGKVPEIDRPCPCSDGWMCCAAAQICIEDGESCPAPPKAYCKVNWKATESWCVLDAFVNDGDVCHFADAPAVQVDFDGERDECSAQRDPEGLYRAFDCTASFGGTPYDEMIVDHGAQIVQPGRDGCRLRAHLLMAEPTP